MDQDKASRGITSGALYKFNNSESKHELLLQA